MLSADELNNLITRFSELPFEQLYDRLCNDATVVERLAAFETLMNSAAPEHLKLQTVRTAIHCEVSEVRSWALPYASSFSTEGIVERVTELASVGSVDRLPALQALTDLSPASALQIATTLLCSDSIDDQLHGVLTLTRIRSEQAASTLQDFADQKTLDRPVRTGVLLAQMELGDQSAVDELIWLSKQADDDERVVVAVALAEFGVTAGCDMIEEMISAPSFPQQRLLRYMISQCAGFDWKTENWVEQAVSWVARCREG